MRVKKKRSPTDSTIRNVRAANKKFRLIYDEWEQLRYDLSEIAEIIYNELGLTTNALHHAQRKPIRQRGK